MVEILVVIDNSSCFNCCTYPILLLLFIEMIILSNAESQKVEKRNSEAENVGRKNVEIKTAK